MSGNYRVEVSPNNRAVCSATHCKKEGVKITKGEIRQGVTVMFKEQASMKWRHWGCVTPSVLHNWFQTAEGDFDLIDGYEELPDDAKEKVKRALEQTHVDDEDWNGDAEMNRYNEAKPMQGMFKKAETAAERKKREKAEVAANGEEAPKKKGATKKRKPAEDEDEDEEEADEQPAPKKARGKKAKTEDDEDDAPLPKKSRAKKAKAEDVDDEAVVAPKKRAGKKAKAAVNTSDEIKPGEDEEPAPKATAKKSKAKKVDADADEETTKPQKRKTKAKAKKASVEDAEED